MPQADLATVLLIDAAILAAGGLCVAGAAVWLARERWRNPLAGLRPIDGPPLIAPLALWILALVVQTGLFAPARFERPGSADWHLATSVTQAATLLLGVGALLALRAFSPFPPQRTDARTLLRLGGVSVATALAAVALCTTQLRMLKYAWRWWSPDTEQPTHIMLEALLDTAWGPWGAVHLVLAAVIVAPLFEEVLFRGYLLQAVWRLTRVPWPAVALSALAFGLVHVAQPQDVLPLVTFGLILGALRVRTRRLWPCMLVHALFNLRTMALAVLNPQVLRAG